MEREIEDLTAQQPEVLLVPEGIQLNYEFMGCDLLVLLPSDGTESIAQLVKPDAEADPWSDVQFWVKATMRAYRAWGPSAGLAVQALRRHVGRHRPLIEMFAAMSEPAGEGEHHEHDEQDQQDGSEVHADLVPTNEEIEP